MYDYYSNVFGSHVRLPTCNEKTDDYVVPNVLPSGIQHEISSIRNRTAFELERIRPEHLKNLPPVIIKTLARLFTRYLSDCKVPSYMEVSHVCCSELNCQPQLTSQPSNRFQHKLNCLSGVIENELSILQLQGFKCGNLHFLPDSFLKPNGKVHSSISSGDFSANRIIIGLFNPIE
ncbi:hypothetical protein DICVIV_12646 [Dictyocaulus viviparus]|uniref:Uncharacterized protein n=1 Tax=Dictyocaulus viviparus TaxID=29172 RepID=A0A0D8XC84_DICVI|nr:hypothetical protein DICVIV_12646 [Dictyocaulus viviparus]